MTTELVLDVFERKGRPTSRDYVAEQLRKAIIRGELPAGGKLNPTEIAEQYGVSQTPAREALQLLAAFGAGEPQVHVDQNQAARVAGTMNVGACGHGAALFLLADGQIDAARVRERPTAQDRVAVATHAEAVLRPESDVRHLQGLRER